ncbi:MAG: glycosyltransferase [Armatimonadota bacterium]
MDSNNNIFLSIIICTHRRPDSVDYTLNSILNMQYQGNDWEIIVVENDTEASPVLAEIIEKWKDKLPLRWVLETIPNLSRARNAGANNAYGEYLAYIDDDVEVPKQWITSIIEELKKHSPDYGGGPVYPLYKKPKPKWYKDEYQMSSYFGDEVCFVDDVFTGCNFFVRTDLVFKVDGFDINFGMAGSKVAYGEETLFFKRLKEYNPSIKALYIPQAYVKHEVASYKYTFKWMLQNGWAGGRDWIAQGHWKKDQYKLLPTIIRLIKYIFIFLFLRIPRLLLEILLDIIIPSRKLWKRYVKEGITHIIVLLSIQIYAIKHRIKDKNNKCCLLTIL